MPYNFAAQCFRTKKLAENGHFVFLRSSFMGIETVYSVHLRLIGKCIVDFLLVIIELFSLGVMADDYE